MDQRRDRSPRGRSGDRSLISEDWSPTPAGSREASRLRGRSLPARNSPTAHRPVSRPRPLQGVGQVPRVPLSQQTLPQQQFAQQAQNQQQFGQPTFQPAPGQQPVYQPAPVPTPEDNTVNLFRQMLQAQDEQIRAQQGQISQLTEMVKTLAVASATAANAASSTAAPGASGTLPSGQEDSAGLGSLRVDADGIVKMDVDTGLRSTRAEGYIPSLPKLDFAHMAHPP